METGCGGIGDERDRHPPRFHPAWKYHFDLAKDVACPAERQGSRRRYSVSADER
jgi:hypothetical protein